MTSQKKKQVKQTLMVGESILNCLPTILGTFMYLGILVVGISWLNHTFSDDETYPLLVMIFIIVLGFPLQRIIPLPSLIYQERNYE